MKALVRSHETQIAQSQVLHVQVGLTHRAAFANDTVVCAHRKATWLPPCLQETAQLKIVIQEIEQTSCIAKHERDSAQAQAATAAALLAQVRPRCARLYGTTAAKPNCLTAGIRSLDCKICANGSRDNCTDIRVQFAA